MADIYMRILMSAQSGNVLSAVQGITSALGSGGLGGALATVGMAATSAAIGLGVASVQAAGDFQNAMNQNVAHAGLAANQVNTVNQALMQMGPAVGQGPTELAKALYPILSGFSGITNQSAKTQVSLAELSDAAKSVAGTTTSVTTAANAGTAAFNAYGLSTNDATTNTARMNNLFDVMNSTVSAGNMQWSAYATVIGKLSVSSRAAGVSFNETNAALATLTNNGYSAQLASTYLSNAYTTLYLKADSMAKNADKLGISFDAQKYKSMDLAQRLAYLKEITGGNQTELLKLMNGNTTALKTFDALSNSIDSYKGNLDGLNHSQGATEQSFQVASSGFNQSMARIQASGQVLLITIGQQLLPTITQITDHIAPVVSAIADWVEKNHVVERAIAAVKTALGEVKTAITTAQGVIKNIITDIQAIKKWFDDWHGVIVNVASAITLFFLPALIKSGVEAVVSGVKIGVSFVGNIIETGTESVIAGTKMAVSFIGNIIHAGLEGWQAAGKLALFIGAQIRTGAQAILTGTAVKAQLIGSFIMAQAAAIRTAIIMKAQLIWSFIETQAQAVKAAAVIAGEFVAGLVRAGLAAGATAVKFVASLIPAIISFVAESLVAAATAVPAMIGGFIATGIAAWGAAAGIIAATWPILLIILAIAALIAIIVLLVTHWSQVVAFLRGAWSAFSAWFVSALHAVGSAFQAAWNAIIAFFRAAWDAIVNVVHNAWNGVSSALSSLWANITSFFSGLPGKMLQFGTDMLNGFVDGIKGAIGNLQNVVGGIGDWIHSHLHFSVPDEGPLATADRWMPDMMTLFASGIASGGPAMQSAINSSVVAPIASAVSPDSGTLADQLSFAVAPTEIANGLHAPKETRAVRHAATTAKHAQKAAARAVKKDDRGQLKGAEKTTENEFKSVDAEIKQLEDRAKHLHKGSAKTALENEIKADRAKEKQLKQEIHLNLTVHAYKADASEIDRIAEAAVKSFGDKIRAQFGNV